MAKGVSVFILVMMALVCIYAIEHLAALRVESIPTEMSPGVQMLLPCPRL